MIIQWTENAALHLENISSMVRMTSEDYAQCVVDRIIECSLDILSAPLAGVLVPERGSENVYERDVDPYRIIYAVDSQSVSILAVLHNAQMFVWPQS